MNAEAARIEDGYRIISWGAVVTRERVNQQHPDRYTEVMYQREDGDWRVGVTISRHQAFGTWRTEINWSAHGAVDVERAKLQVEMLTIAIAVAEEMEG